MSKRAFRLTAAHCSGRVIEQVHPKLREAQLALSYSIHDNGYGDKRTAQTACMIKPGESVTVAGTVYSIQQVAA